MKKLIFCSIILISLILSACGRIYEIEDNTVITACIADYKDNALSYSFYVSVPDGSEGGEDTGSKSSAKVYKIYADNFSHAIKLFEKSGIERADVNHLTLFAATKAYYKEKLSYDEKYLHSSIPSSSLVYACVVNDDTSQIIDCLDNEYKSKADDFAHNVFESSSTPYKCTLSELFLACNNPYFTCAIPIIETESYGENKMAVYHGTAMYSLQGETHFLTEDEHQTYMKWRKKYPRESQGYKLDIYNDNLMVKLNDISIVDIAGKYTLMNFDILNAKYYAKRCFLNYEDYEAFFKNYNMINCVITGDSK